MHLLPLFWAYRHHFHTEDVDDGCMTQDCGVEVKFDQSSCASHENKNINQGALGYVGKIQDIVQVEFSLFQFVIFRCRLWDTFDQNNVKEEHDSTLIYINSRKMWHEVMEAYVLPKHCN